MNNETTSKEALEKENQELKEKVKILKELNDINKKFADLATKTIQENNKLKKVINSINECIPIEFYHLKKSKYYTLNIRGALIDVSKEKYYELLEGLDND